MLQSGGRPCPYGSALKGPYSGKSKAGIEEMIGTLVLSTLFAELTKSLGGYLRGDIALRRT
jgi:hypothetical protein